MTADHLLDTTLPLVAAPMAGGATTVGLARSAIDAGAFSFLAGGYKTADGLSAEMAELSRHHDRFGVNLFVPGPVEITPTILRDYAGELGDDFARYGLVPNPEPVHDDDGWSEKLALLRDRPPAVVSFTFGLPSQVDISTLQRGGSQVLATVTTAAEAKAAAAVGVDGVIVQGAAAGGHSATFDAYREIPSVPRLTTAEVVRSVSASVRLPIIAAGGVDGPAAVRELIAAGAQAVAVGTLLLRADESGASQTHRDALADTRFSGTAVTRAFTGRPARGLRNAFMVRHGDAPVGYPEVHHLTKPLRAKAASAGDGDAVHLWAGTGFRAAQTGPAADILTGLAAAL